MSAPTRPIPSDNATIPKNARQRSLIEQEMARLETAARQRLAKASKTYQLQSNEQTDFVDAVRPAFGYRVGTASDYSLLPAGLTPTTVADDQPVWRIEFHGLASDAMPVGVDIAGDVILGRGDPGPDGVDFDFERFNGLDRGVSRRHAMLRPTGRCLYLIDLNSTNGTKHNAMPINQGVTRALKNNDTITFGQLSVTIKIIDGPVDA